MGANQNEHNDPIALFVSSNVACKRAFYVCEDTKTAKHNLRISVTQF